MVPQLTFYASYHSHPINIAIHMICIPIILWSTLLFLAHIPLGENATITRLAPWLSFQPNAALVMNACYVAYYFALEPFGAVSSCFPLIAQRAQANLLLSC